ncbi:hypothetical protein PL9214520262 [Planktothrix tepida PCC 9214]|uniref:Uncharacterized protein n=1 Tax=Planktothrix tepida PCC 9214 TaxID=671072 RepID=A0A1J1LML0_9CYAN|nr:hypothetical protein PL9214520262 [Planktothrix tepida PCC 9214]
MLKSEFQHLIGIETLIQPFLISCYDFVEIDYNPYQGLKLQEDSPEGLTT